MRFRFNHYVAFCGIICSLFWVAVVELVLGWTIAVFVLFAGIVASVVMGNLFALDSE